MHLHCSPHSPRSPSSGSLSGRRLLERLDEAAPLLERSNTLQVLWVGWGGWVRCCQLDALTILAPKLCWSWAAAMVHVQQQSGFRHSHPC